MTPTDGFERALQGWFQEETVSAPPLGLHDGAIERARRARQRPGWVAGLRGWTPGATAIAGGLRVALLWVLVGIAISVGVFAAAVAGGAIRFESTAPVAVPSATPITTATPFTTPTSSPTPAASPDQYLEDLPMRSGMTTASRQFGLPLTFKLLSEQGDRSAVGDPTWWCYPPSTSSRMIALFYMKACITEVRFIRPYAVDCGTPDEHPNAETLAAAILAKPGVARDLGTIAYLGAPSWAQPSGMNPGRAALPLELFREGYEGRAIQTGGRLLAPDVEDPDACQLLSDPAGHDPTIEIRGDMPSTLILMDVHDELVVLRFGAGYDGPSGAAASERGYLREPLPHLYEEIYDISWY